MLSGFKYRDQVLGKDVAVKFRVARSAAAAKNYLGTIRRMQVHLDDDGELEILHQVIYQDGDEEWYDLAELDQSGRLAWLNFGEDDDVAVPAKKAAPRKSTKKIKREAPSDGDTDGDEGETAKKRPSKKRAKTLVSTSSSSSQPSAPKVESVATTTTPVIKSEDDDQKTETDGEDDEPVGESTVVSPEKPAEPRQPREPAEDEMDLPKWVLEMHDWMLSVPHGSKNSTVSETNARSVMRQVKKLVRGEGITYKNWEEGIVFYEDEPVNLSHNFEEMLTQAKRFEGLHGKDKGNGWLMQHPITKLDLYKQYRVDQGQPLE
ncbi:expressed unknown protein [Seminavis robusta]|uniref:Uncharacterized protein n=1 Tax=Seminavis robusta TaxID=568900 RepID=A0A9N8HIP7_9STRA|nr:expressed unknown protein [Seminavis robusta]|eukprot:Sro800_g204250.1 n/a (319) ;mRNA; f:8585-9718